MQERRLPLERDLGDHAIGHCAQRSFGYALGVGTDR
jgi:hypothetical protein